MRSDGFELQRVAWPSEQGARSCTFQNGSTDNRPLLRFDLLFPSKFEQARGSVLPPCSLLEFVVLGKLHASVPSPK
jgi:hypothetical protein